VLGVAERERIFVSSLKGHQPTGKRALIDGESMNVPNEPTVIPGVVQNGVVVPEGNAKLPEGARVEIVLPRVQFTPEEQAEFDAWDRLGNEAWGMIDEWEKEERT
jgi:hypothetical protein